MSTHTIGNTPCVNSAQSCADTTAATADPSKLDDLALSGHNNSITESKENFNSAASERPAELLKSHHKDLYRATITKRVSLHVARALMASPDNDQASRGSGIINCADHLRDDLGELVAVSRCRHRACPYCSAAKQRKHIARLGSALGFLPPMRAEAPRLIAPRQTMVALKLTLNSGEACPLGEIRERIKIIHKSFKAMTKLSAIADNIVGYFRSSETTEAESSDDELRANPHLHGLLLLRGDADLDSIAQIIRHYWPRAIKRAHAKAGRFEIKTVASVQGISELSEQTKADLLSWLTYCLKGGSYSYASKPDSLAKMLSTSDPYWQALDSAIYKLRLIDSGGRLREALSKAEDEYQASKVERPRARPTQLLTARPNDWVFLHTIAGYARFKDLSALKTCSALDLGRELHKLPEAVGDTRWNPDDVLDEIKTITLNLSPSASASIAWLRLKAHLTDSKQRQSTFSSTKNTRLPRGGGSAWYEPKERLMKSPIERGAPPSSSAQPSTSATKPS
jgi:hypothetical protein